METPVMEGVLRCMSEVEDYRADNARHPLVSILAIALIAVVDGSDSWVDVADYAEAKEDWLGTLVPLPNGVPSHDTFSRVFRHLRPESLEACLRRWLCGVVRSLTGQQICLDGKSLRGSHSGICLVSAWCSEANLVLGQLKSQAKRNEQGAMEDLLRAMWLKGCTVTIDAAGCQRSIAKLVAEDRGRYVLALKQNQKRLHEQVSLTMDQVMEGRMPLIPGEVVRTVEKREGNVVIQRCCCTSQLTWLQGRKAWSDLQSVAVVERRTRKAGVDISVERRYYISNWPNPKAEDFLRVVRNHWGIENKLHWVLDVVFRDDACQVKKDHGPENFSLLRRLALNLIRQCPYKKKASVRVRRKLCAWKPEYLMAVLGL